MTHRWTGHARGTEFSDPRLPCAQPSKHRRGLSKTYIGPHANGSRQKKLADMSLISFIKIIVAASDVWLPGF